MHLTYFHMKAPFKDIVRTNICQALSLGKLHKDLSRAAFLREARKLAPRARAVHADRQTGRRAAGPRPLIPAARDAHIVDRR